MLMATWQFLNTFSLMVSPLMFRFIYSNSISWMPGLIWFVESGLFLIGFALFFRLPDWTKPQRQRLSLISEEEAELTQKAQFARGEYGPSDPRYLEVARRLSEVQHRRRDDARTGSWGGSVSDVLADGPSLQRNRE